MNYIYVVILDERDSAARSSISLTVEESIVGDDFVDMDVSIEGIVLIFVIYHNILKPQKQVPPKSKCIFDRLILIDKRPYKRNHITIKVFLHVCITTTTFYK